MLSLVQVLTFTWIISYARIIVQAPQLEKNKTYLGQPGSIQKQTVAHQGFPFYLKIRKTKGNEHRKTTRTEETLRENLHQIKGIFNYIVRLQEVHFCVMETAISSNGLFENTVP